MASVWIDEPEALAIHEAQLAEHGGAEGVREHGLLQSALARARHLDVDEQPDLAALAAAYCSGIAKSHPFIDGNKRTAFVVMEVFVVLNRHTLNADDEDCVRTMLSVADGTLSEAQLTRWLRARIAPL